MLRLFGAAADPSVRIVRKDHLARKVGLPPGGGMFRKFGEILAANTGGMGWLSGLEAADLSVARTVLRPAAPNPRFREPASRILEGTRLNPQFWREPQQRPLVMHEWRDVLLASNGNDMAIWRGTTLEERAFGVPAQVRKLRADKARPLGTVALCDDYFMPGNPCHVLCDRMVRAVRFREAGVAEADIAFVFGPSTFGPYARDRIVPAARGLEASVAYRVDRLLILSTSFAPADHPFHYGDAAVMAAVVGPLLADLPPRDRARKLYLSRTDATRRPMVNERALIARLEAAGFQSVTMGALSPREQLGLCREASVIVAPHGAAMMNVVAAEPGTRVVELFNPEIGSGVYTIVSALREHDYRLLFGAPVAREDVPADAWEIDIDAVMAAALG